MDSVELKNRFDYHAPKDDDVRRAHENVRESCGGMARIFNEILPDGREKSTAISKLEEAMFWANAAIARNQ